MRAEVFIMTVHYFGGREPQEFRFANYNSAISAFGSSAAEMRLHGVACGMETLSVTDGTGKEVIRASLKGKHPMQ